MTYTIVPLTRELYPEYEESFLSPLAAHLAASALASPRRFHHQHAPSSKERFDLTDDEKEFNFTLDVPGVEPSEIKVTIEDAGRTFRVDVQRQTQATGAPGLLKKAPNFSKAFALKGNIDAQSVAAVSSQGVLTVTGKKLPKQSTEMKTTKEIYIQEGFPEIENPNDDGEDKAESAQKTPYFETTLELPGVRPSDMKVTISSTSLNDPFLLRIAGSRRTGTSSVQKFAKSFSIGRSVDIDKMTAHLAHGVLLLQGAKDPRYDPFEVKVSEGEETVKNKNTQRDDKVEDANVETKTMARTHLASPPPSSFRYQLSDDEKEIRLAIETPGMKASDLTVKVEDAGRVIRVSGTRTLSPSSCLSSFERTFSVTKHPINVDTVTANLSLGVLTVHAEKTSPSEAEQENAKHTVVVEEGLPSTAADKSDEEPDSDVSETRKHFEVAIELPGVKPSDLKVEVEDVSSGSHILHLSGSRTTGTSQKFARKYKIGRSVDVKKLTARLNYGVLMLEAPKDPRYEPVEVRVEEAERAFNKGEMEKLEDELAEKKETDDENKVADGKTDESWEAVDGSQKQNS